LTSRSKVLRISCVSFSLQTTTAFNLSEGAIWNLARRSRIPLTAS